MHALPDGALRIVHLSDAHLTGDGSLHQGVVDTTAALDRVLAEADRVPGARLLVGSGDLSDDGSVASYEALRSRASAWAGRHGAHVALVPGNHDLRGGFAAVLGHGHGRGGGRGGDGGGADLRAAADSRAGDSVASAREADSRAADLRATDGPPEGVEPGPVDGASEVDGWRVVTLDTSVPRAGYGLLRDAQLDRLRDLLSTPARRGTVLVLHHPPLPAPTTLHESLALQRPEALGRVIEGTDVRVVLAGHYHHHVAGSLVGVPVLVAPGVANDTDVLAAPGTERAVRGSGFLVVDVHPDGTVRSTPVRVAGPDDGSTVFELDEERTAAIAAAAGVPRG